MNTKITHSTRAALIALLAGAAAAPALIGAPAGKENHAGRREPKPRHSPVEYNQPDLQVRPASEDPRGRSARELLGMDVRGNNGEKLGDLHDLVVDANTGKVTHAVVASGGILGIGSNLRAVPIEAVTENANGGDLSIGMNKTRWKQAPVFTEEQLISFNRGDRIPELREFYGQGPAPRHEPSSPHASPRNRDRNSPSEFVLVSDIRGKDVHSEGREIGEIDDVIVQLHARSATALFDPDDNYVGGGQDYLVPLAKLTGFHTETLGTSIRPDEFSAARPLSESSTADSDTYLSSIHLWPGYFPGVGVTPYDTTTYALMENTRHDRALDEARRQDGDRDRVARTQPPIDAVRRAVRAEVPDAQQNILVTAEEDKLVLRGTVPTENIKDRIEDRAEEAAAGWDVDSELRVAQSER